jgi:hypothetical protein
MNRSPVMHRAEVSPPSKGLVAVALIVLSLLGVASVASADWSPGHRPVVVAPTERYVVRPGDTLSSVVRLRYGAGHGQIVDAIASERGSWSVQIGEVLWLPPVR